MGQKIRSKEDFLDYVGMETSWRKQDLSILVGNIEKTKDKRTSDYSIRVGIAMLYAHWEGWVKSLSESYIIYLNSRKLYLSEVSENILAMSIKSSIIAADKSNKYNAHFEVVSILKNLESRKLRISETLIDTGSNLNWERFEDILNKLGIDTKPHFLNEKLIDSNLLKNRNSIAHGQHVLLDYGSFMSTYKKILEMLEQFTNDLINLVFMDSYKSKDFSKGFTS